MTPKSAKAKGRRLAARFGEMVRRALGLDEADVRVTPAGVNGSDLTLSRVAKDAFPFDVEAKNVERLNMWDALAQVEARSLLSDDLPLVVFSRNHSEVYVAMRAATFLGLMQTRQKWMNNGS